MLIFHFEPLVCVSRYTNACSRLCGDDREIFYHILSAPPNETSAYRTLTKS
jgi:hypothetical protein